MRWLEKLNFRLKHFFILQKVSENENLAKFKALLRDKTPEFISLKKSLKMMTELIKFDCLKRRD